MPNDRNRPAPKVTFLMGCPQSAKQFWPNMPGLALEAALREKGGRNIEPREVDNNDLKASRAQEWRPRCSQALAQWVVEILEET